MPAAAREVLSRGSTFRFNTLADPVSYYTNLTEALTSTITQLSLALRVPSVAFGRWRQEFLARALFRFRALPFHNLTAEERAGDNTGVVSPATLAEGIKQLRNISRYVVITVADKMEDAFVFVCKPMYIKLMFTQLAKATQGIRTYEVIDSEEKLREYLFNAVPHDADALDGPVAPMFPTREQVLAEYADTVAVQPDGNPHPEWIGSDYLHTFEDGEQVVGRITAFTPADHQFPHDLWHAVLAKGTQHDLEEHEAGPLLTLQRERIVREVSLSQLAFPSHNMIDPTHKGAVVSKSQPIAYMTAKLHEGPLTIAMRMISASGSVPTTAPSVLVSECLKLCVPELSADWVDKCLREGLIITPGCPIIPNVKAVRTRLATAQPPDTAHMQFNGNSVGRPHLLIAADFTSLYDLLWHLSILERMPVPIHTAFERQRANGNHSIRIVLGSRKDGVRRVVSAEWSNKTPTTPGFRPPGVLLRDWRPESEEVKCKGPARLMELIRFVLLNAFVTFRGKLYHQVIGLPMGTNMSPLIANVYLSTWEKEFLDRCIAQLDIPPARTEMKVKAARCIALMCRFIDDVFLRDPPYAFEQFMYGTRAVDGSGSDGIYPSTMPGPNGIVILNPLQLNITDSGRAASFMDARISQCWSPHTHRWVLEMGLHFKFANNPVMMALHRGFPHIHSAVSDSVKYNVLFSEMCRFIDINTRFQWFVKCLCRLVQSMVRAGYDPDRIRGLLVNRGRDLLSKRPDVRFTDIVIGPHRLLPFTTWTDILDTALRLPPT